MWAVKDRQARESCQCDFRMCASCINKISRYNQAGLPSKLWPKSNNDLHVGGYLETVDCHYFNDPECPWVKAFVKQEGEPKLDGQ